MCPADLSPFLHRVVPASNPPLHELPPHELLASTIAHAWSDYHARSSDREPAR